MFYLPTASSPTARRHYGSLAFYRQLTWGVFQWMAVSIGFAAASPPPLSIAVIGDYGDNSRAAGRVARLVNGWQPDVILTVGDNRYDQYSFDEAVGRHYCDYLANVRPGSFCNGGNSTINRFFPSPGNHDYDRGIKEYLDYFHLPGTGITSSQTSNNERFYDFIRGPVHFFAIDSHSALTNSGQLQRQQQWLKIQLQASASPWQVVYFHHPPFSSARHGSTPALQWPFADWGADLVLAGHDHTYERLESDKLVYFVNGLGGRSIRDFESPLAISQRRYNGNYGAMRLTASAEQLAIDFINIKGDTKDHLLLTDKNLPRTIPPSSTRPDLTAQIASAQDDVEQQLNSGVMYLNSSDLELGEDPRYLGKQAVGLRFTKLAIEQGTRIHRAYLEFTVEASHHNRTNVHIKAQAADNASAFSSQPYDLSQRPLTKTTINWAIDPWNEIGATMISPDISSVIQPVLNRQHWQTGNSLVLVVTGQGERSAASFEDSPKAAVRLKLYYSPPDSPPSSAPDSPP